MSYIASAYKKWLANPSSQNLLSIVDAIPIFFVTSENTTFMRSQARKDAIVCYFTGDMDTLASLKFEVFFADWLSSLREVPLVFDLQEVPLISPEFLDFCLKANALFDNRIAIASPQPAVMEILEMSPLKVSGNNQENYLS